MHIVATGSYCAEVRGELPPLHALVREATGASVRRIGRFVQLALVGAGRCVHGLTLPVETATYFTSGRGDLETTLDVLVALCEHGQPPSPFSFVNTAGTSVGFHVAQIFGIRGRSQFVTRRYGPLEAALRLAELDMAHGGVKTALLGSADLCTLPVAAHRARAGVAPDSPVGEASHWFLLAVDERFSASLGVVRGVRSFTDEVELRQHLGEFQVDPDDAVLAVGQHVRPDHGDDLREATGIGALFDYRRGLPWYDCQTAHAIQRFLAAPVAHTLVHIDGVPRSRATLLVIDAARPGAAGPTRSPRDRRNRG